MLIIMKLLVIKMMFPVNIDDGENSGDEVDVENPSSAHVFMSIYIKCIH